MYRVGDYYSLKYHPAPASTSQTLNPLTLLTGGLSLVDSVWWTQFGGLILTDLVWWAEFGWLGLVDSVCWTQFGGLSVTDLVWWTQFDFLILNDSILSYLFLLF